MPPQHHPSNHPLSHPATHPLPRQGRRSGVVDWAPFDPGVPLAYKKNRTKSHLTGVVSGHHANISHVANNCRGLPPKLLLGDKIHREINIYKHDLGL